MKLFGQLIHTVVNTVLVPVAIASDIRDIAVGEADALDATAEAIDRLKSEAGEDEDKDEL